MYEYLRTVGRRQKWSFGRWSFLLHRSVGCRLACLLLMHSVSALCAFGQEVEWIVPQQTNVDSSFRGLAVVSDVEAWASGTNGVVIHTVDAGATWMKVEVPDTGELDFRDVAVLQNGVVLLMSAGLGQQSKIFRSSDGGRSWAVTLQNQDSAGFFDAVTFLDAQQGILVGDPIEGHLDVYRTSDGGAIWVREQGPTLQEGEYLFAASGTNVASASADHLWIATGGSVARVFRSSGSERKWTAVRTPVAQGSESSGVFSIAFRDPLHGVIVGGDYKNPAVDDGNVAYTADGGITWSLSESVGKIPHRACVRNVAGKNWISVGRTGVAVSRDDGASWKLVSTKSFYTFDVNTKTRTGWMAGSDGKVARFTWPKK